jgi:hypothetical protein
MTDEQGRPTVSSYYDAKGMTPEERETKDKQILAVAGPWRSQQYGIDTMCTFVWSRETVAEALALRERLKQAGFDAIESITGSKTK